MDVRLPDGTIIRNVPDGTTKADLVAKLQRNGMAVPSEWLSSGPAAKPAPPDPTEGMSGTEKFLAGAGKAFTDIGRGTGQIVRSILPKGVSDTLGLPTQADIDEARRLDAPLMKTGAGTAGAITGGVATALPTVLIPGANTVTGAALTGSVMGALQPTTEDESRAKNALVGGLLGGGTVVAGRAVKALYQGGKALLEPFTEAGRDNIAGRTLARFADDPAAIKSVTSTPTATGALPTLAEQTGDRGIAQLQDALRSADPQIENQIGQRLASNNAARVAALQSVAGDSTKRATAEAARDAVASPLYKAADQAVVGLDDTFNGLMSRPAFAKAVKDAQTLAKNTGLDDIFFRNAKGQPIGMTGEGAHLIKKALDDMGDKASSTYIGDASAKAAAATKGQFLGWMEQTIPEYKAARDAFAAGSKPLNAMDIGDYLAKKATSATSDLAGNPRLQANALLRELRDEPALIEKATGRKGLGNALTDILTPDQANLVRAAANESDRAAAVASAGAGPGSATAKRMAAQNVLAQLAGPTGLPQSWAESVLAQTVLGKPLNVLYGGVAEPKIQQALAEAVLDPAKAQAVLDAAMKSGQKLPPSMLQKLTAAAARTSIPAAALVPGQR